MLHYRNKIEFMPLGRGIQTETANFVWKTVPEWLTVPSTKTFSNNSLTTGGEGSIKTSEFTIADTSWLEFELTNFCYSSETPASSLVLTNGTIKIGFETTENHKTNFIIYDGDTEVKRETQIGKLPGGSGNIKSVLVSPGLLRPYAVRPKNVKIIVCPVKGEVHILINNVPSYSYLGLNTHDLDLSGDDWYFELTSDESVKLTGVNFTLQQNFA